MEPPVEDETGDAEARNGHRRARDGLVAAAQRDHAVEVVAARHELDGVCDHLTADERGSHAVGAHGDAVVDRDGVELHGRAAGRADALLDRRGELPEVVVARANLDPRIGQADDRLAEGLVIEARRLEHRARGRPVRAAQQHVAPADELRVAHAGSGFVAASRMRALGYEPSVRSVRANSPRCTSARAQRRSCRLIGIST